ncbi:MAG: hypothetical protein K9I85_06640 [Saprospiraceae bacterium]|nr:hypothetical protein [Saprospiraceae bacterium]
MLRQIKTFIGVQALDLEVHVLAPSSGGNYLPLVLKWTTHEERTISKMEISLKEVYSRGRWTRKKKQTFLLGATQKNGPWKITPGLPVVLEIDLAYQPVSSPFDRWRKKPILQPFTAGLAWIENLHSHFYLEITTSIQGAALPIVKQVNLDELHLR